MLRLTFLLAFALGLSACDSSTPSSTAHLALASVSVTHTKSDDVHRVTASASVLVEGGHILLDVEGETLALSAADAYLVGSVLAGVALDNLPNDFVNALPPVRGGDRCDEPIDGWDATDFVGEVGFVVDHVLTTKCPPRPPMPVGPGILDPWFDGSVRTMKIEEHYEWQRIPGGFVALDFDPGSHGRR